MSTPPPSRPANPYTRRPTLTDRWQLWALQIAKLRRRDFANKEGDYEQFYEEFFDEKDSELYGADPKNASEMTDEAIV